MRSLPLLLLLAPATLAAQRTVTANRLTSTSLPSVVVEAGPGLAYAGTQAFELYGVANAEQHFFVELDGTRIKRLLWIQFEGYHAGNNHTYNYRDETAEHSGRTWHRRISAISGPPPESRPNSDGARMREFIRSKGWTMGSELMLERLVWILDSPARNELLLIYMEDVAGKKLTEAEFHQRAVASFTVRDR